jgi:hypothetical protein
LHTTVRECTAAHAVSEVMRVAAADLQHALPAQARDLHGLGAYLPLIGALLHQLIHADARAASEWIVSCLPAGMCRHISFSGKTPNVDVVASIVARYI